MISIIIKITTGNFLFCYNVKNEIKFIKVGSKAIDIFTFSRIIINETNIITAEDNLVFIGHKI